MPDVLLTDIDGTLVDSNALHAEAWRRTLSTSASRSVWTKLGVRLVRVVIR